MTAMTNKVKFKLKITGFELEMEGTKESTAMITSQVSDTLRGLIIPPSMEDSDGNVNGNGNGKTGPIEDADATIISSSTKGSGKKRNKKNKAASVNTEEDGKAIDFQHDPEKFGNPSQDWNTATKSLWILYVVKNIANLDELTNSQITNTFNKHFKQSKTIQINNVSRDLGKLKVKAPSLVGEMTQKSPSTWYLTDAGQKHIQNLIIEQKKGNGAS